MLGIGAIHVALDDVVERGAGGLEAKLDLFELDFDLPLDRQQLDLAGVWIVRRNVRHEDEVGAFDGR